MKSLNNTIDFELNTTSNFVLQTSSSIDSLLTTEGQIGFDTTGGVKKIKYHNGTSIFSLATETDLDSYLSLAGGMMTGDLRIGDISTRVDLYIGRYGSLSETESGAAYIQGNSIVSDHTTANTVKKTTYDDGQFIKMRYDKGITFHTGLSGTVGTQFSDDDNERMRIYNDGVIQLYNIIVDASGSSSLSPVDRVLYGQWKNDLGFHIGQGANILGPLSGTQYLEIAPSSGNASCLISRPITSDNATVDFITGTDIYTGWSIMMPTASDDLWIYDRVNAEPRVILNGNDRLGLFFGGAGYAYLQTSDLTTDRTFEFPDSSGTFALTSDLSDYLPLTGGTLTGTLTVSSVTASTIAEFNGSKELVGTKTIVDAYLTAGATTALLENNSNWTSKVYTGTAITGTYQGQKWYDANYLYEAVEDNTWVRLTRG